MTGAFVEPVIKLLVEQRKLLDAYPEQKAWYMSGLMTMLSAYWFKARRPICYTTMVMSLKDYKARCKMIGELECITDGLIIVVLQNGYRIIK